MIVRDADYTMNEEIVKGLIAIIDSIGSISANAKQKALNEFDLVFLGASFADQQMASLPFHKQEKLFDGLSSKAKKLRVALSNLPPELTNRFAKDVFGRLEAIYPNVGPFLAPGARARYLTEVLVQMETVADINRTHAASRKSSTGQVRKPPTEELDEITVGACRIWCEALGQKYSMTWHADNPAKVSPMICFAYRVAMVMSAGRKKPIKLSSVRSRLSENRNKKSLNKLKRFSRSK